MVSLNSILMTTVIVFGVFDNYIIYASSKQVLQEESTILEDKPLKKPNKNTLDFAIVNALWDHMVNSKKLLEAAIKSHSYWIEADVTLGHLNNEGPVIPIMGNPPAETSDLSLQEFLDLSNKLDKQVKLDFKSTSAFSAAIPIMKESFGKFERERQPWLHADILPGPGSGGIITVNKDIFLDMSAKNIPDSTLSLGWTTVLNNTETKYTYDHVEEMLKVLENYKKPVTFAVRALFAINSINELKYLLAKSYEGSTVTIWCMKAEEKVGFNKVRKIFKTISVNQTWLDFPEYCDDKLDVEEEEEEE